MPAAQKTPLISSLNVFAQQKVKEAIYQLGKALPCSVVAVDGPIITVAFAVIGPYTLPQVVMPLFGPEYIRYPIQVGDLGVTFPVDVYLGGISGLGPPGAVADMSQSQGNLSNLVFLPCGNKNWTPVDPNAVTVYGPNGVVIRDTAGKAIVTVDGSGNCVVHGAKSFSWDCNGYGERYTFQGGSAFQLDTYFIGATVTTIAHDWVAGPLPTP